MLPLLKAWMNFKVSFAYEYLDFKTVNGRKVVMWLTS